MFGLPGAVNGAILKTASLWGGVRRTAVFLAEHCAVLLFFLKPSVWLSDILIVVEIF